MGADITRNPGVVTADVGTSVGNSSAIPCQDFAGAIIHCPESEVTLSSLTIYVADSDSSDATFRALKDYSGTAVTVSVVAGDAVELHPAAFAALQIKIVADAISAGTSIPYNVTLKS